MAHLEATQAGFTKAQEGMITKGGHGSLAARVAEIRREHLHTKAITQESPIMVHDPSLLQSRNCYYQKPVMGSPLLEPVQESTKPWHERGLATIKYLSRRPEIHHCK